MGGACIHGIYIMKHLEDIVNSAIFVSSNTDKVGYLVVFVYSALKH